MKKIRLLFVLLVFYSINGFSQGYQDQSGQYLLPKMTPVSPDVAGLGRYGGLPINLSTGSLSFTIPIYTIKVGGLELPINLTYAHSGLLIEEEAGVVGLGWTLNAGGMITRQIRGEADESTLGYITAHIGRDYVVPFNFSKWNNLDPAVRRNKEYKLFKMGAQERFYSHHDTQPDKYSVRVGNISANFSYNELGEPIFFPHKNYMIDTDFSHRMNRKIVLTDDSGIKYLFDDRITTISESLNSSGRIFIPPSRSLT